MTKQSKTVLLGMSGGVDSSVAALLLKKQGYNVIGIFIKSFSDTKNPYTGECAYKEERRIAKMIAAKLDIPLFTLDTEKEYKKNIISPLYEGYSKGKTPNPDIDCNYKIKFPLLWKKAKELKADYIATGHYARIKKINKGYELLTGLDKNKDQSYFLYRLTQKDLSHTIFPIGNLTKIQVREIAKKNHFSNYNKQGSRGICFVGQQNMKSFLEKKIKNKFGKIIDPNGKVIGTHPGSSYFTIGQRIGPHLSISIRKPKGTEQKKWYIAKKLKNNTLIAAPFGHPLLKEKKIKIKNFYLINPKENIPKNLQARFRHLGNLHKGKLSKKGKKYYFTFKEPQGGIAEGQSIVFYKKEEVIGGGVIDGD